jgi:hypothetical protein
MGIERDIEGIRAGMKAARFPKGGVVSQGIVLHLPNALGWSTYQTEHV